MIRLGPEWTQLLEEYERAHSDPRNRLCHEVGHPSAAAGATAMMLDSLVFGAGFFLMGLFAQVYGHQLEGTAPPSARDARFLLVGWIWWLDNRGLDIQRAQKDEVDLRKE